MRPVQSRILPFTRVGVVLGAVAALVGCADARPAPFANPARDGADAVAVSPRADTDPVRAGTVVAETEHFAFHSNMLLNLHHFLYQSAAALARRDGVTVPGRPIEVAELATIAGLGPHEREAWEAAIDVYRRHAVTRDLLFDNAMYALKRQIITIEDPNAAWPASLPPDYAAAWHAALPVYRDRFWAAHDAANRAWISALTDQLADHEGALVRRMTAAYGGHWPAAPVRVDVCAYANWAGGYTSGEPAHIVVSSLDDHAQGTGALEVLFHEVSHTPEMFGALQTALAAAFAARGVSEPRGLWHVFIFLSAGDAVHRTLGAAGVRDYVHYGERTGVYARGPWAPHFRALREHWLRYLAGEVDQPTTLARTVEVVRGVAPPT